MVYEDGQSTGNGNGNKMNLRLNNFEGLLCVIAGDGTTAKANCLRQVISRNKTDMATDASRSLDLMRQVFQPQINEEIRQIIDRHLRTTFQPAIENLKRNGHGVAEEDLNELARGMLDGAKSIFVPVHPQPVLAQEVYKIRGYESDDSDISAISQRSTDRKPKRGRPRKDEEAVIPMHCKIDTYDLEKWAIGRLTHKTSFIFASKLAENLGLPNTSKLFAKYPKAFRYICSEEDKKILVPQRLLSSVHGGRAILMQLEDGIEIQGSIGDLPQYSFTCPEAMLDRVRMKTYAGYNELWHRMNHTNPLSYLPK